MCQGLREITSHISVKEHRQEKYVYHDARMFMIYLRIPMKVCSKSSHIMLFCTFVLYDSLFITLSTADLACHILYLITDIRSVVCLSQLVQLLSAVDPDDPVEGHHFYFSMVPEKHINPNFTIRDNQGYIHCNNAHCTQLL